MGTFQFFAARRDTEALKLLADHVIDRHYPELRGAENPYSALLDAVAGRQAELIAAWMSVGFIHGVMNTDNMSVAGDTIDYGPCAFMDTYHPGTVYSSIDHGGRYAYGNQPGEPVDVAVKEWAKSVEKASDGELTLKAFPASQLGGETEVMEQARFGSPLITITAYSNFMSSVPDLAVLDAPYLADDFDSIQLPIPHAAPTKIQTQVRAGDSNGEANPRPPGEEEEQSRERERAKVDGQSKFRVEQSRVG